MDKCEDVTDSVKLITFEKFEYRFPKRYVKYLKKIETITGGFDDSDDESDCESIPITLVKKKTLDYVLHFCSLHDKEKLKPIPKPLPSTNLVSFVQPKIFAEWICTLDSDETSQLILSAEYLDIRPLLELACARIALFFKNKSPEEILKGFNVMKKPTELDKQKISEKHNIHVNDVKL